MIRGERADNSSKADGVGVAVILMGFGVFVGVEVPVVIGKIKVIAGSGKRVVVGVSDGITVEVGVCVGIPGITV